MLTYSEDKTDTDAKRFLAEIWNDNPDFHTLSLAALPTWRPEHSDLLMLSRSLAASSVLQCVELGVDESLLTFDLSVLASIKNLRLLKLCISSSELLLQNAFQAVSQSQNLEQIEITWIGADLGTAATIENDLFLLLRQIPNLVLRGFHMQPGHQEAVPWEEVILESCDLTDENSLDWLSSARSKVEMLCLQVHNVYRVSPESSIFPKCIVVAEVR